MAAVGCQSSLLVPIGGSIERRSVGMGGSLARIEPGCVLGGSSSERLRGSSSAWNWHSNKAAERTGGSIRDLAGRHISREPGQPEIARIVRVQNGGRARSPGLLAWTVAQRLVDGAQEPARWSLSPLRWNC